VSDLAFLLDVDNTLLDNDRLKGDLDAAVRKLIGPDNAAEFWRVYEGVRKSEEYVDLPETLREFARLLPDLPQEGIAEIVNRVDFRAYVYPGAFDAIAHLKSLGLAVIVSDGDQVFQKRKIEESGLANAVDGRVILTVHKQAELGSVFSRYPASHYALIDDKTAIIADIGREYPELVTTVLVCQGKYARLAARPGPDLVVPHIADLVHIPVEDYWRTVPASASPAS